MIREANTSDAARIIRIHLNSWRSTYSNVFPKEVFDKQESEYNTRVENIKNAIRKGSSNYALLEEDNMFNIFKKEGYKSVIIRCLKENTSNEFYQKIGGKVVELESSNIHGIDINECVYEFNLGDKYS